MRNMYSDSVKQWNVFKGCQYDCVYCKKSFQHQSRRQKNRCMNCYTYKPHFHEERLYERLPKTEGDQFVWVGSSEDISFCKDGQFERILNRIRKLNDRTFFLQTKNPAWFEKWKFPDNCLLGITLETDSKYDYCKYSTAPLPLQRMVDFKGINHARKCVTIEPIMEFDYDIFRKWIRIICPERVYIGYDTKKCGLPEPPLVKTLRLIEDLETFTKVKRKYMGSKRC